MQTTETESHVTPGRNTPREAREKLVSQYIRGQGIEIGALHQPLPVPQNLARVKYVDRFDVENLRIHYPELIGYPLVNIDIVDDGEKLSTFKPESQDFIIANHFLEHTQDPIGTIQRHIEVLKPDGILYMAVPDKRYTFDHLRSNTSMEHFLQDHAKGAQGSYMEHVCEYVKLVDGLSGKEFDRKVEEICRTNYSIHFHVWDAESLRVFMSELVIKYFKTPIELMEFVENPERHECICILRKRNSTRWGGFLRKIRSQLF